MNKTKHLRELFNSNKLIRVIGAHSALSAKIGEGAGFDCVWASGLEISTSYGVPDANILTMTDFLNAAISMNESVSIPVIADCDTGFGNSNNVIHMVKKYESAGIAAVCIEDKHFPKVNSFIPGRQELAPISEFVGKILRRHGLYSSEFTKIRRQVEEGALKEFRKNRHLKKPKNVPYAEHEKLKAELSAKEKALAQMSEECLLLKKSLD